MKIEKLSDTVSIVQADCLEFFNKVPDGIVDLVITSPPYDQIRDYKGYTFDFEGIAKQLYRVVKDGGVIVWVVGDQTIDGGESGTSFRQALHFQELGFNIHDTMIYEKTGMSAPSSNRYYQAFEYMFVLSKGKPNIAHLLKDKLNVYRGETNRGTPTGRQKDGSLKIKSKMIVQEYGVRFNIWRYKTGFGYTTKDKIAYQHPAIFPDQLAIDHIKSWSNEGDLVLDPMAGSFTVGKACVELKRRFVGCEISPEYYEIGKKRMMASVNSLKFDFKKD